MTFGGLMRGKRLLRGMTQNEAAKYIGVSRQAYVAWEHDKVTPRNSEHMEKIRKVLGITDSDLSMADIEVIEIEDTHYDCVNESKIVARIAYLKKELSKMERILEILKEES